MKASIVQKQHSKKSDNDQKSENGGEIKIQFGGQSNSNNGKLTIDPSYF